MPIGKRHGTSRPVSGVVVVWGDARNDAGGRALFVEPEGFYRGAPEGSRPCASGELKRHGASRPVFLGVLEVRGNNRRNRRARALPLSL